jgi:hypothetical protein
MPASHESISPVFYRLTLTCAFTDQIAIRGLNGKRFSDSGDSGSAILERLTNKVAGLLFAGG